VQITQDLLPNRNVKKAVAEVSELLESEIEQQAEQQKQKQEEQQKQQHEEQQKQQQEEQQTDEPQLVRLVKPLRIQPIRISARNRHILSSGHLPAMAVPITDCNCKASHIILLSDEDVTDPMDAYTEQILSNVFLQLDAEAAELLIARLKLSKEAEEASDSEVEPQPDWLISPISQRSARDEGLARF
jgi:flagellar biosynthesis GTPase FlhF